MPTDIYRKCQVGMVAQIRTLKFVSTAIVPRGYLYWNSIYVTQNLKDQILQLEDSIGLPLGQVPISS